MPHLAGRMVAALTLAFIAAGATLIWEMDRTTIRPVIPGQIYRAGQPTPSTIEKAVRDLGIRTVLNLRGPNPSMRWYVKEVETCRRLGIRHVDIRLQSDETPPRRETRELVSLLATLPKPILLHCAAGAHRSAWAAAVARAMYGYDKAAVMNELSIWNRHICLPSMCPAHRFFKSYDEWLKTHGKAYSEAAFRQWVTEVYCPSPYDAEIQLTVRADHEPLAANSVVHPSEPLEFQVTVTNRSPQVWRASPDGKEGIRLGVRSIGPFQSPPTNALAIFRVPFSPARDILRVQSAGDVPPNGSRESEVRIEAPKEPGYYAMQFDMVDEGKHWFSDQGTDGVIIPLDVR